MLLAYSCYCTNFVLLISLQMSPDEITGSFCGPNKREAVLSSTSVTLPPKTLPMNVVAEYGGGEIWAIWTN